MNVQMFSDQLINYCIEELKVIYETREAENIAYLLLEESFDITKIEIMLNEKVNIDTRKLDEMLGRLKHHEPIQYVVDVAHFYGYRFQISKDVLIPRPETEELVDWAVSSISVKNPSILEIGTGSGCISICLAKQFPQAKIVANDLSLKALKIAQSNAKLHKCTIDFFQSDFLETPFPNQDYDLIISNPPYIPEKEKAEISPNVLNFEPHQALFVPNNFPLIFYEKLGKIREKCLKKEGVMMVEIHEKKGREVINLFKSMGYSKVQLRQDLQGKDRLIRAML